MKLISRRSLAAIAGTLLLALAPMIPAQGAEPGMAIVSIYRAAPGKHLEMIKWLAAREAIDKEAGVGATQWYVHVEGDSWDFVVIAPKLTEVEGAKVDELSKKKGLKTGFAAGLEIRHFIASHTDTIARGPLSAADLVKEAGAQ